MSKTSQLGDSSTDLWPNAKLVPCPQFRADIEGLRAIAVLLVVAYHAGIPGFDGGYIGVDIFFAISGYLITWLLVHEVEKTGTVDLLRFYSRRARRLLPAVVVVLLATVIVGAVVYAPFEQRVLAETAFATATYHSNIYFAGEAVNYLGVASETNPLLHTWSLSVEEQFYFVWPLFVMLASGVLFKQRQSPSRLIVLIWMIAVIAISFALSLYLTNVEQPAAFFLSPTRAWEFAIGAVGVLIPISVWRRKEALSGWLGLGGILAATALFDEATQFPGFAALVPTVCTVLVLRAHTANAENQLGYILKWHIFQKVGRLSYSWYLWHWPILVFAGVLWGPLPLLLRVGLMAIALMLAEASYRWVESPIRHNNFLGRKPSHSIAMAVVITLFSVSLSLGWMQTATQWSQSTEQSLYAAARNDISVLYENGCHVDILSKEPKIEGCTVSASERNFKVILFGDSHAAQWYESLAELAAKKKWQLTAMTKSSCPYVDAPFFNQELRRDYAECDAWRKEVLNQIQQMKPDLVIATSSAFAYPFSRSDWIEGAERTLKLLSRTSENVIILRDSPHPGFDVPVCLARRAWRHFGIKESCEISGTKNADQRAYSAQKTVAEQYKNVGVVDMLPYICDGQSCLPQRGNQVVYSDTNHLTIGFTLTLSQALSEKIDTALQKTMKATSSSEI